MSRLPQAHTLDSKEPRRKVLVAFSIHKKRKGFSMLRKLRWMLGWDERWICFANILRTLIPCFRGIIWASFVRRFKGVKSEWRKEEAALSPQSRFAGRKKEEIERGIGGSTTVIRALHDPEEMRKKAIEWKKKVTRLNQLIDKKNDQVEIDFPEAKKYMG
jgi:hypothetical protein